MASSTLYKEDVSPIKVLRLTLYGLIFLIGLVGNLLVMIVVRARGKRRIFHDYFLLNLAVADLLYILCLPADIYIEMARFPFTEVYCKLIYPLTTFAFSLSILTLTSMAVGRCYVMKGNSRPPIKDRTAFLWIAILWFSSLICVLPLSITARSAPDTCVEDWPSSAYRRAYTVALLVLQYIAPLSIIGIAYIHIGFVLMHKKQPRLDNNIATNRVMLNIRQRNVQIIRTLAVIVVLFALLMLPHEIAWMMIDFGKSEQEKLGLELIKYSPILTYLHSCSNPLVYGLMISQFRRDAKKCLCCVGLEEMPDEHEHGSGNNLTPSGKIDSNENIRDSSLRKKLSQKSLITKVTEGKRKYETQIMTKDNDDQHDNNMI